MAEAATVNEPRWTKRFQIDLTGLSLQEGEFFGNLNTLKATVQKLTGWETVAAIIHRHNDLIDFLLFDQFR